MRRAHSRKRAVVGHRDETGERLQVVAVELGIRSGKHPEARRDGSLRHRVHGEVDHAIEPRRAAQVLGDADEAILRVLAGAKKAGGTELTGRERQVAGDRGLRRGVADFVAQHLQHPALVQVGVSELRGQDEIRIEIGAGVMRRVHPLAPIRLETIREERGSGISMSEPRVQQPPCGGDGLLELHAIGAGTFEGGRRGRHDRTLPASRRARRRAREPSPTKLERRTRVHA